MDNKTLIDNLSRRLDVSRDTVVALIDGLAKTVGGVWC